MLRSSQGRDFAQNLDPDLSRGVPGSESQLFNTFKKNNKLEKYLLLFFVFVFLFFKVLKSWDSEPGTPLERSGSKFCAKSRPRELRSIYGDPFHEDFVPAGVDDGSGPGSHTFPARCAGGARIFWSHTQPTIHSPTHTLLISLPCAAGGLV